MLHPDYWKDTTGSVLPEICAPALPSSAASMRASRGLSNALLLLYLGMLDSLMMRTVPAGKEYTNADSRYATRDSFVVAMEAVTAFVEGPGCYAAVYGMLFQRPWVSAVQILVSAGQLYGTVLYFVTSLLEGGR